MPALNASFPAYRFLKSLTRRYRERGPPDSEKYEDPRNAHLLVYVGAKGVSQGCIVPRDMAAVNPWDSAVQGGDACWEGLRVYRGKVLSLDKHLRRLMKSAKGLGFENVHAPPEITHALFQVLAANGMRDGAHVRLTLTRGEKSTSSMNPKFNVYGTTLIILPEWKPTEVRMNRFELMSNCYSKCSSQHPCPCSWSRVRRHMITPRVSSWFQQVSDAILPQQWIPRSITITW